MYSLFALLSSQYCGFCHSNSLCLYLNDREHPAPILGDNHLVGQVLELVPQVRVLQLHSGSWAPALLNREEKLFSQCRIVISLLECFSLSIAQVWRARKVRVLQLISRSRVRMLCLYYLLNRGDFIFT